MALTSQIQSSEPPKEVESSYDSKRGGEAIVLNQNPHAHFNGHLYYGPEKITKKEIDEFYGEYLTTFGVQCDRLAEFLVEGVGHWKPTINEILKHVYDHYPEQSKKDELCDVLLEAEEMLGTDTAKMMLHECMPCLGASE